MAAQHEQNTQETHEQPQALLSPRPAATEFLNRHFELDENKKRKREEQAGTSAAADADASFRTEQWADTQSEKNQQQQTAAIDLTRAETPTQQEHAGDTATNVTATATSSREQTNLTADAMLEERRRRLTEETLAATLQLRVEEAKLRQLQEALRVGQTMEHAGIGPTIGSHEAATSSSTNRDAVVPVAPSTPQRQGHQEAAPVTVPLPETTDEDIFAKAGGWHIPSKPRKYTKKQLHTKGKESTKNDGPAKKRRPGRPLGSSTRAKHLDPNLLLPSSLGSLELANLHPSDDFIMSPELAASIMAASKPETPPKEVLPHSDCWVDPFQNNAERRKAKSKFVMPCSRQPDTLSNVPLASYRKQWKEIKESLENEMGRRSVEDSQRELLDRFSHDARVGCVSILRDESITGKYSFNSQKEVLNRMEDHGYFTRQQRGNDNICQQPTTQNDTANPSVEGMHQKDESSESKIDYLSATPNLMMLPLEPNARHPRQA